MVVSQLYKLIKNHRIVHLKWMRIIVCKLYLNEIKKEQRVHRKETEDSNSLCNNVSFIDQGKAPYKHIPYHVLKKTVKCKVYLAGVPPLNVGVGHCSVIWMIHL